MPDSAVSRPGKSKTAFRTISEVATVLDLPQHVLRFWESKFPQVNPLKRGGGRRYYRPEDIDLLRQIRALLYQDGYTIKGAQNFLRQKNSSKIPIAESTPPASAQPGGISPERSTGEKLTAEARRELKTVLGELESLQELLRS